MIAANAKPPVCKIMDFGKYRYEPDRDCRKNGISRCVVLWKRIQIDVWTGTRTGTERAKKLYLVNLERSGCEKIRKAVTDGEGEIDQLNNVFIN